MTDTNELLNERGNTHGNFVTQADRATRLYEMMIEGTDFSNVVKHSLMMIATKLSRIAEGNEDYADHWDDISGYAVLQSKRIEEENK